MHRAQPAAELHHPVEPEAEKPPVAWQAVGSLPRLRLSGRHLRRSRCAGAAAFVFSHTACRWTGRAGAAAGAATQPPQPAFRGISTTIEFLAAAGIAAHADPLCLVHFLKKQMIQHPSHKQNQEKRRHQHHQTHELVRK